ITLGLPINGTQTAVVAGTVTSGNVLTIAVFDAGLTGGTQSVSYTVVSGDTTTSIATGLKTAINGNTGLSGIGVTATSSSNVLNIKSTSQNLTTYSSSLSAGATETLTMAPSTGVLAANYNNVNALVSTLPGGATTFQGLTNKAVKSASIGTQAVNISQISPSTISYGVALAVSIFETLTAGSNLNGNSTFTVGTPYGVNAGDVFTIIVYDASLTGGQESVSYTTISGDSGTSIATGLKNAINADTKLQAIGLSATSSGAVVTTAAGTATYSVASTGAATITLTNGSTGNATATIGGAPVSGNTVSLTVHFTGLSGGLETATYTCVTGDTIVTTAAGLAGKINADAKFQSLGITATNGANGTLAFSESFSAQPTLVSGANTANVSATDGNNNTRTNPYQVAIPSGSTTNYTFDLNGNMTSDGTNSYAWDAANRLIKISYPGTGNYSTFSYDGFSRKVEIVETASGSVTSTKQFVVTNGDLCEARDGSGNLSEQFFVRGQKNGSALYFYARDDLGSVRDVTNAAGAIAGQYSFDPFGRSTTLQGTFNSDFQYAGYYEHSPSGLNLTMTRAFSPTIGRWLSRDRAESGPNLYAYVSNDPLNLVDPTGLFGAFANGASGAGSGAGGGSGVGGGGGGQPPEDPEKPRRSKPYCQRKDPEDPNCKGLIDEIKAKMAQITNEIDKLLVDDNHLFENAYDQPNPEVTGTETTWLGHINKIGGLQNGLDKLINRALKLNCPIPPGADALSKRELPNAPRGKQDSDLLDQLQKDIRRFFRFN
ncbi:MAG TPA: RHS repeat-associated core domain-containing protein, partial [Planktothrix sp.]